MSLTSYRAAPSRATNLGLFTAHDQQLLGLNIKKGSRQLFQLVGCPFFELQMGFPKSLCKRRLQCLATPYSSNA
jgi:hypothetical protein